MTRRFPADFTWGAATSAHQIEGAAGLRGASIWDTFSRTPGRVVGGHHADVSADHYHRYRDDVRLMAELGLTAYRFSVSWPRVQPDGSGAIRQKGLDFYRRLTDELLAHGIQPWLTLYHWDLPQALEDKGGWPERDTAYRFADYAAAVHEALEDRVHTWATVNEPWCAAFLGHASGEHAPGRRDPAGAVRAAHHLNLAHGLAVQAIKPSRVGGCVNLYAITPATGDDHDAARRIDGLQNRFFLDPILKGGYPEDVLDDMSIELDFMKCRDLAVICQPIDLLLVNYYSRFTVSSRPGPASAAAAPTVTASPWVGSEHVSFVSGGRPVTAMGWEIDASGLLEVLTRVAFDYRPIPMVIAENGAAFPDVVSGDRVHDPGRLAYLRDHLAACLSAIQLGIPLEGYFAWSLLDNFEWAWGYGKRFGLVHVDFATQRRLPKDSALWYAEIIRQNKRHEPTDS
ncbi:GH1 family beta-glucosidase [Nonomuraea typhae]|uniref:Beta-glucosidase n=1 Tax=Nonomuraea typhae TaxID=2603600 RepID=A0ABW7Z354_9ACTN